MTSKTRLLLVMGTAVLLAAAIAGEARWREETARRDTEAAQASIEATFVAYRDATANREGAVAASYLAADTRAYFDGVASETRYADERRLQQLDPVRYLLVLTLRAMVLNKELDPAQLTPEALTALAFDSGIIGKEFSGDYTMGDIVVDGDRAAGRLQLDDTLLERRVWFQRQSDVWGLNLLPVLGEWAESLEERAGELGVQPDLVAEMTVEAFLRSTLDPELFQPLQPLSVTQTGNTDSGDFL